MQIFAFDSEGTLIAAMEAERKKNYFCPECKDCVRLRGGIQRRTHFYHPKTSNCQSSKKSFLHFSVQLFLADLLPAQECHLEKSFPSIQRIADCVWEPKKIIFEIQCSTISKEEVKKRIQDYASVGYTVIWIFHDSRFFQGRLTAAEYYLKHLPHYYTNITLEGKGNFYDRFENKKLPINLTKPLFSKRKQHWKIHFEGDRHSIKRPFLKKSFFIRRFFQNLSILLIRK